MNPPPPNICGGEWGGVRHGALLYSNNMSRIINAPVECEVVMQTHVILDLSICMYPGQQGRAYIGILRTP